MNTIFKTLMMMVMMMNMEMFPPPYCHKST